jgi:hypothetical protein
VECATAVLNGQLSTFEGCLRLADLRHVLVDNWLDDPDFEVFGVIACELDGLPIGAARQYWGAEALEREDRKLADYEALVKAQIREACRNVVARFSEKPNASV